MSATTAVIRADQLELVLAARRITTLAAPWCVMSAHVHTQPCRLYGSYRIPAPSLAGPMSRGEWYRALARSACTEGAKGIRRIYGTGIRALQAEDSFLLTKGAK